MTIKQKAELGAQEYAQAICECKSSLETGGLKLFCAEATDNAPRDRETAVDVKDGQK